MVTLRDACSAIRTVIWDLCFPADITFYIDPLVRAIFTLYHLPFIALVVAITHSALERIVWVLIVPVAHDMERQSYTSSYMITFATGLYQIFVRILPYSTLGFAVATAGHKVLNCCVETMVDAYSTHRWKDYPLMAARLQFIMEDRERYYTFLVVLCILFLVVLSGLHTNILVAWPSREPVVVTSAWCIITVQFCFVVGSVVSHAPSSPRLLVWKRFLGMGDDMFAKYFYGVWWETYIHYMRYIAIEMVLLIAMMSLFYHGPFHVLSSSVELLMYLNIPHLVGHAVLSVSTSSVNIQRSFHWLKRHSEAFFPVLLIALPYQVVLWQAMYYFRRHWVTVFFLVGINILLFARAIDLVREFDVTVEGSVHWRREGDEKLLPPHLSIVLEDAYESNHSGVSVVSFDLLMDVGSMKLYSDGTEATLKRIEVGAHKKSRDFLRNLHLYLYAVPRLLSAQSPGYLGGKYFRRVREVARVITYLFVILFAGLVCGLLMQSAFPQLRRWPVQVHVSDDKNVMTIDHIVLSMHFKSNRVNIEPNLSFKPSTTEPAFATFNWSSNSSSAAAVALGEDWYPSLCKKTFWDVSIWEVSLLALSVYLFDDVGVNKMLQFMSLHMNSDWVLRERHGTNCIRLDSSTEPTGWGGYFDFYSPGKDFSIIAIRGTDMTSFQDFLIDFNMFFDVVLYHVLSSTVPGAVILPSELLSDLLRLASVPATTKRMTEDWESLVSSQNTSLRVCENNNYGRDFFVDVYNHLAHIGSRAEPPKHILLTGHSLGGAVASIIGARMGIQVVNFNAPGISLSRKKFDIELRRIHRYVMSVISSHDIVPMIGGNGGEEHHVECLAKTRELCHAMEFLVGMLWQSCGSIRSRYPMVEVVI